MAATISLLRQTGVLLASKGLEVSWTLRLWFTVRLPQLGQTLYPWLRPGH
jgi:hypothetical protein